MATVTQIGALIDFVAGNTIVSADVDSNFSSIRTQFNNLVSANNQIDVDTIRENTADTGVTIDSVLLKDGAFTATAVSNITGGGLRFNSGSAIATSATTGFLYLPVCAGTPSGTPALDGAGAAAVVFDSSAGKLWVHFPSGSWRFVQMTAP